MNGNQAVPATAEIGKSRMRNRRVWITGASSGIGRALAIELAREGARVVLSGRDAGKLEAVAAECSGHAAGTVAFDVASREETHRAAETIRKSLGALDTAVLNAGICEYVDLPALDVASIKRVMEVNFLGMIYGVEAALPLLREGTFPHLAGMSSSVAWVSLPRAEAYGASKAAIRYFLDALRVDLDPQGIDVSVIYPGFVKTPLTDLNDFPMPMRISAERSAVLIRRGLERRALEISFPWLFCAWLKALSMIPVRARTRLLRPLSRSQAAREAG